MNNENILLLSPDAGLLHPTPGLEPKGYSDSSKITQLPRYKIRTNVQSSCGRIVLAQPKESLVLF